MIMINQRSILQFNLLLSILFYCKQLKILIIQYQQYKITLINHYMVYLQILIKIFQFIKQYWIIIIKVTQVIYQNANYKNNFLLHYH